MARNREQSLPRNQEHSPLSTHRDFRRYGKESGTHTNITNKDRKVEDVARNQIISLLGTERSLEIGTKNILLSSKER